MMMSLSCGTFILAAVIAASVSLQKSFTATQLYSGIEGDQLRVLDYIAMDCRRAASASVTTVTVNGITENALVLTLPPYYSSTSSSAVPNTPVISSGAISYGTDIVTVTYEQNGSNFTREVKVTDSSGTTVRSDNTTPIAKNVSTFTVNPIVQSNPWASISCSIMFFPTFLRNSGTGTWWSGGAAPGNGTGANGDWYVIDATATDQSTVGNVYFKSGGAFSLVQNVKATTVYCNTFLRNASAR
jgi:hypothetical protein